MHDSVCLIAIEHLRDMLNDRLSECDNGALMRLRDWLNGRHRLHTQGIFFINLKGKLDSVDVIVPTNTLEFQLVLLALDRSLQRLFPQNDPTAISRIPMFEDEKWVGGMLIQYSMYKEYFGRGYFGFQVEFYRKANRKSLGDVTLYVALCRREGMMQLGWSEQQGIDIKTPVFMEPFWFAVPDGGVHARRAKLRVLEKHPEHPNSPFGNSLAPMTYQDLTCLPHRFLVEKPTKPLA